MQWSEMQRSELCLLVLSLLLPQCGSSVTPRVSFSLGSPGRALTSFLLHDVQNCTTLLLSPDHHILYVGAQDAVLVLDVRHRQGISLIRKLEWSPTEKDTEECSMKGKRVEDCANFIRVLEFLNRTHIYTCGTFAFSPRCVYIDTETLSMSQRSDEGRGRCPYDPYQPNTAIAVEGELYTATVADYRGNRPVISRHLSEAARGDLKLDDTLGWLEEPTFMRSMFVPVEEKIYFFFSEVGREYDFIDRLLVSRVAQICISDVGGQRTLQRRWTTFAKAQLLCQDDGELPYNLIQDMDILPPEQGAAPEDTLFYGVFTSQWRLKSGLSAVCVFSLGSFRSAFSGSYKVLNRDTLQWSSRLHEKIASPGECGLHNASDSALRFVKENFLTDESVRPVDKRLTLVSQHSYSHISVKRVQAANGRPYTTLFLLTGLIHKVVLLQTGPHIIEEIQVFKQPQTITSMKLSKDVIFIGMSGGVLSLPMANCSFYRTCAQCVLSQDPFCGWDSGRRVCAEVGRSVTTVLVQDVEQGQVDDVCVSSLTHRTLFGSHMPTAPCPPGVLVTVSLNEVVRLHCPAPSLLSRQQWERPNSRLSEELYLQLEDGSLSFVATPATLGHYLCVSVEKGFQQTMAVYQVRQNSIPISSSSNAPTQLITEHLTKPFTEHRTHPRGPPTSTFPLHTVRSVHRDRGFGKAPEGPCYLKELLIVSGLLVLCFSLLLTLLMYTVRMHCHNRTAPQPPTPPRPRGGTIEPHPKGQRSSTSSNGHLPNIPL
ncbi:semaphorin-4B isoform X2 [Boleophthalmus pectinirostris]|uniref:semaphorin-4B isoform X2 n=1 Tax=Boleophthalmus pectinirostris TaxID=150288 RepID=UPI002431A6DA|nr:semaphorin-4B isoform X2 [Boleophthalmus pectinirostris]